MARGHAISCPTGHAAEVLSGARGVLADVLLLQRPRGLDRIEIRGVGREVEHADALPATGGGDTAVVMGAEIVHHEHISATQAREQVLSAARAPR